MWRPNEVVEKHRTRAAVLWASLIAGVFLYASLLLAHARRRQKNPSMSFAFRDIVYKYPDMEVCLYGAFGCDEFLLGEACARSSSSTEGGAPNATFNYDWYSQQGVSSAVEENDDGWCVSFKTSEVTNLVGEERTSSGSRDFFTLDMSWYPGGAAGTSTTCVSEEGTWTPHRELMFFFLVDPETGSKSTAAPIPYSCVTNSTMSYVSNYVGIGLTKVKKLHGTDDIQYKTTSTTSSSFKTTAKPNMKNPYAHVSMVIHQETNSLETVTEVDPLDIAEIFGNVGGFWDLLMIFWPIFFVSVSVQSPTLKRRNFRKSVVKGAEVAVGVTASTSARLSSSVSIKNDSSRLKRLGTISSSSSRNGSSGGNGKVGSSTPSRHGSFAKNEDTSSSSRSAKTEDISCSGRIGSFRRGTSGGGGGKCRRGGFITGRDEAKTDKMDCSLDSTSGTDQPNIVKLVDTK